jgi:hypothetical protein
MISGASAHLLLHVPRLARAIANPIRTQWTRGRFVKRNIVGGVYAQLPVERGPEFRWVIPDRYQEARRGRLRALKTNLARLAPAVRRAVEEAASRRAKLDPALLELEMTEGGHCRGKLAAHDRPAEPVSCAWRRAFH